jgi:hypothetical protein
MAHQHLFRHPVGHFPARARWYLAGVSMLALLLVAAHFAIQAHTQDLARATVGQWARHSGGSVEQVRFHLLRNALTLDGVHMEADGVSLSIPEVLLYGRIDSLLGGHPALSRVTMSAPRLQLSAAAALHLLALQPGAGDTMFHQIWFSAHHLEVQGGTLVLSTGPEDGRHWTLDGLNLLIREQPEGRSIRGGFLYHGASLALQSRMLRVAGGAAGDVAVSWDRVDGRVAAREIMSLSPLNGELSGRMRWQWRTNVNGDIAHSRLEGGTRVVSGALVVDDTSVVPSLQWQVDQAGDRWHAHITAASWSLAPLKALAPLWYGRRLQSGRFTGAVAADWTGGAAQVGRLRIAKGEIRDLDYASKAWSGDAENRPDWRLDRVDVTDARLDLARHVFTVGDLGMAGGEIRLTPVQMSESGSPGPWRLQVKAATLKRVAVVLVFADGRPVLRTLPLTGQARLAGGAFTCELHATDAPVSWKIAGQGRWAWPGTSGIRLDVDAAGLPLTQLRAILPFAESPQTGSAVQLEGLAGLALAVDVDHGQWTASGTMAARDVGVSWQGDSWHAARVNIDLDKVGTGVPVQALHKVQVNGWQYQGALQSLTPDAESEAGAAVDLLPPLRAGTDWRIDAMAWHGGTISFGRADAVWASNAELQLSDWAEGQMAPFSFTGDLDGGAFRVAGSMGRFGGPWRAKLKGRVTSARPFFLNEWLQVSGAPRIVRGRWSSRFTWQDDKQGLGHGHLRLWLHRWQLESGVFPNDPFLGRTGFGAHDLLHRLRANRVVALDADYTQAASGAVAWSDLGDALLAAIRAKADASQAALGSQATAVRVETRIRLHGTATLSHNERVRLRKLWRAMRADRHLVLDLLPQLSNQNPDADLVATIRHTQDMIERFMIDRGIPRRRLFPVWPTQANRGQGSIGIRVEVRRP